MDEKSATLQWLFDDALKLHRAGKLADAEHVYRQILAIDAGHADSLHLLGVIASQHGRHDVAVELIGKAIAAGNGVALYHSSLGNALKVQGKLDEAVASYQRALDLKPNYIEAHSNLGNAFHYQGRLDAAVACYERALDLNPDYAEAHNSLGNALNDLGKFDAAIAHYERAVTLKPDYAEAHYNLGNILRDQGKPDAAVACYERAVTLRPNFAEALFNLGSLLGDDSKLERAHQLFRRAHQLRPLGKRAGTDPKADFSVLLLKAPGPGNTPSDYIVGQAGYDSYSLMLLAGGAYDFSLLRNSGDVVVNLISDVDRCRDLLPSAVDLVDRLERPVINHPRKILATGRDTVATRLAGIPRCRVPKTVRFSGYALSLSASSEALANFSFPLLVRMSGSHGGHEFEKLANPAEVAAFLARKPNADYYVIEYVPYESEDGYFRKYRLIFVDGQIFSYHLAIGDGWKVHHFRTDMVNQAWMREEEEAFVRDPTTVFKPEHWNALRMIQTAVGLDYFGIDCALDRNGDLVVFEVNATMLVHGEKDIFAYKEPYIAQIKRAFDAMLANAAKSIPR